MPVDVTMPKLSDTMEEGKILKWLKHPGDHVAIGEIIAEVETDKANMELEAYDEGTLAEVRVPEGESAPVGAVIAVLAAPGDGVAARPAAGAGKAAAPAEKAAPSGRAAPRARGEPRRRRVREGLAPRPPHRAGARPRPGTGYRYRPRRTDRAEGRRGGARRTRRTATRAGEAGGARRAAPGGGKPRRALAHPAHHRQAHGRIEARDPALLRLDRDRDGRGGAPEGGARRARGRVRGPHLHARRAEGGGARAHARARAERVLRRRRDGAAPGGQRGRGDGGGRRPRRAGGPPLRPRAARGDRAPGARAPRAGAQRALRVGRPDRRHLHALQPRHAAGHGVRSGDQPAAGGHPGRGHDPRDAGRARGPDRPRAEDDGHRLVRSPHHRRHARRALPPRAEGAAREPARARPVTDAADYDLIVLGAGPGGYVEAIRAAQLGLRTAVVERDRPGGVCGNWGCIPSKAILADAALFAELKGGARRGILADNLRVDYARVIARSREVADRQAKGVEFLFKKNRIAYHHGTGRLVRGGVAVG